MDKIKKILVPLDGSKNSFKGLEYAINLAKPFKAKITGLYVIPLYPHYRSMFKSPIEEYLLGEAQTTVEKANKICKKQNVSFFSKILHGEAAGPKIVSYSQNKKFDNIVMGSRGRSLLKEIFLGSTSNYVVHKSKIPVTIVN